MRTPIPMPQVTLTMADGVILRWLVQEGTRVEEGQPLLEVETDKTAAEVAAPRSGTVLQLVAREGDSVAVGDTIAFFDVAEGTASPREKAAAASGLASPEAPVRREDAAPTRKRISPVAARLAREHGLDPGSLVGTGQGGLIVEADVRRALEAASHRAEVEEPEETVIPFSPVRRRIAERMLLSRTVTATVTTVAEVDMGEVKALRGKIPVSYTVFAVRAAALALRRFPYVNSELRNDSIVLKRRIHVGVAVSMDDGLVVPVIRDAADKGLARIAGELEELSVAARAGSLTPEQVAGGTFTVTNSGVYGSLFFTPALNYPQAAILGMGKVADAPVARDGGLFVRPMMYLSLSYEHRIIDGALAVGFLQEVKRLLEKPDEIRGHHTNSVEGQP